MNPSIPSRPVREDDLNYQDKKTQTRRSTQSLRPIQKNKNQSISQVNSRGRGNNQSRKPKNQAWSKKPTGLNGKSGQKSRFANGSFNNKVQPEKNEKKAVDPVRAKQVGLSRMEAGKLKIVPLGGLGQIGKNLMALEYENDIIVMDLGFMFPGPDMPGVDYIIPETSYLEERKHKIKAHLITHAHEDHVGGIPFILPKLQAPIYGAKFTIKYIEKKLEEYPMDFKPDLRIIDQDKHEILQLGVFKIEFIRITHSIPDACALAIHTPVGTIFNTGDWRFDKTPLDGKPSDMARLKQIGDEGVLLLMCDSTSCEKVGASPTEQDIIPTLTEIFGRNYNKRVIISTFASQVSRIQVFIDAAQKARRKLAIVGRSLLSNVELAVKMGYIKVPAGLIIKAKDVSRYPDGEVCVITTGHQGEENSALVRMGTGEHKDIKLKPTDVVVLSSSIIPGNEKSVWSMVDGLYRHGAYVYQESLKDFDNLDIMHTSGHAYVEEIKEMIKLIRPKYYLPIHGELHHMVHNAMIAERAGITRDRIFIIENGQTLVADKSGQIKKGAIVPNGTVLIDGNGIGDVQTIVLKDRLAMSSDGIFTAVATVDKKTGKLIKSPDIISRGFIYMKENEELINKSRVIVRNIFDGKDKSVPASSNTVKNRMREELSNYLYKVTKRSPIVLPVVIEV